MCVLGRVVGGVDVRGGGIVMFDEAFWDRIRNRFSGVRRMGDGGSGFTLAIIAELIESRVDNAIIKVAKCIIPVGLFGEVEVKDLGVPKAGSSHDDMR